MNREEKTKSLEFLNQLFKEQENVLFTSFKGLTAEQMNGLRKSIREKGEGGYRVVKNTLLDMVLENCERANLKDFVQGPTGVAYSSREPINLIKMLVAFAKENEVFDLRGGIIEGKMVDREGLADIAVLPSREQLLATLLAQMRAPISNLTNCLYQVIASIVYVLDSIAKNKSNTSKD